LKRKIVIYPIMRKKKKRKRKREERRRNLNSSIMDRLD
jgi:hypothetical protein